MKETFYKIGWMFVLTLLVLPINFLTPLSSPVLVPNMVLAQEGGSDLESGLIVAAAECAASAFAQHAMEQILAMAAGVSVPTKDVGNVIKEQFLDCLLWAATSLLIQEVTDNIIEWAQTGFDGNPAFVDDFDGWLEGIAKEQIDLYIDELNDELGGLLCSPFRRPIIEAVIRINLPSRFERDIQCTFDEAVENIEGFLDGDFSQGGWNGWIKLVHDNPYSEFIAIERELDSRIAAALNKEQTQVEWADGFLSWNTIECEGDDIIHVDPETGEQTAIPNCRDVTNTPGSVIEEQINKQLGSSQRRVEAADEINEMISALMYYLVQDLLTDEGGLRGYNNPNNRSRDIIIPDIEPPGGITPGENPSGGTPGPTVTENRNGVFFTSSESNPRHTITIPIPAGVIYDQAAIEFDVDAPSFPGPAIHSIMDMRNPGVQGRYFALDVNIREGSQTGARTGVDDLLGGQSRTRTPILEKIGNQTGRYTFRLTYSTFRDNIAIEIFDRDTGEDNSFIVPNIVEENDIRDMGQGLVINFGIDGIADNGGYYPPYGWSFSNLGVTLTSFNLGGGDGPPPPPPPPPPAPSEKPEADTGVTEIFRDPENNAKRLRLLGTVNPNGAETTVWFEYEADGFAPSDDYDHRTEPQSIGSGFNSIDVSAEPNNAGYLEAAYSFRTYYRVVAENEHGRVYGDRMSRHDIDK
jgi:hypothetical protein